MSLVRFDSSEKKQPTTVFEFTAQVEMMVVTQNDYFCIDHITYIFVLIIFCSL